MGIFDRLFGRDDEREDRSQAQRQPAPRSGSRSLTDEQAIQRYRYMLQTAPPETIEQAHAKAFAQLTPEQRRMVLQELSQDLPEHERAAGVRHDDDPRSLARMATRAEMRQPGTLERRFGGVGGPGIGLGGLMAGSFLSTIAGVVIGSAIADQFFGDAGYDQGSGESPDAGQSADGQEGADTGAEGFDAGGDGGGDFADTGGGFGDFGGDFGGGDFVGDF